MQEVLLYFPEIRDISASAQIENLQLIKEIAGKCGYKVRFVASPHTEDKEDVVSIAYYSVLISKAMRTLKMF